MDQTYKTLNKILVSLFNDIMRIEEKVLINDEFSDISITDMHIIEAIGYNSSKNMSTVAKKLNITVGTLTIAINNLVKKGYVKRVRSVKDRRVVLISLTPLGQKAYKHHEKFHDDMISSIVEQMSSEEVIIFTKIMKRLEKYFESYKK